MSTTYFPPEVTPEGWPDDEFELMSVSDASGLTRMNSENLKGEIRDGRLTGYKVRGRWYVTRPGLRAWLKRIEKPAGE